MSKSFVTLGKPLKYEESNSKFNIYIRDSMLLAPQGKSSLKELGKLSEDDGDFTKRVISNSDLANMKGFLFRDKKGFTDYAIQDAIITLKHAIAMEKFYMTVNKIGIPITLSGIGRNYVFKEWEGLFDKHLPYQISSEYLMGNADEIQTPKGLFASRDVGAHLSYFIANYKGGRNESFMYGSEESSHWYDYDLNGAYTTGMAHLTLPDYYNASLINTEDLEKWNQEQFFKGYLIVNCDFSFKPEVKYPSIPCYVDKNTTVYPLNGSTFITGPEFYLAKTQGCEFNIKSAFYINQKEKINVFNNKLEPVKPFHQIIKDLQSLRKKYPKKHINNLLYKELGNGLYGNIVRGMANKKQYDSITKQMSRVNATPLSNPILASGTTAFIRSVIGECLHNIQLLNGKVVSVTTDGFITNIEDTILTLDPKHTVMLRKFREIRVKLSGDPTALEIKTEGKGILSWTTRGQLGVEPSFAPTTGFQKQGFDKMELVKILKDTLKSKEKSFEFTRNSLRGAKDIFEKGGGVRMVVKEQTFRLLHDNRRKMDHFEFIKKSLINFDQSYVLRDSQPLNNITECKTLRFLSKFPITIPFNKNNTNRAKTTYKSNHDLVIRNFIKAYYCTNEKFGLKGTEFRFAKDLIKFINGMESTNDIKVTVQSISNLKNRRLIWRPVPKNEVTIKIINELKLKIPHFNVELFMKS